MKRGSALAAVVIYALSVLAGIGAVALSVAAQGGSGYEIRPVRDVVADPIMGSMYGMVGAVIAYRRPGNRIGWALLVAGAAFCTGALAHALAEYLLSDAKGEEPLAGLLALAFWGSLWTVLLTSLTFLLILFPSGEFPSRAWRLAAIVTAAGFASVALVLPTLSEHPDEPFDSLENPFYIRAFADASDVIGIAIGLLHLMVFAAGAGLVARFWKSRGAERAQFKWLALAVSLLVVGLTVQSFALDEAPILAEVMFGAGLIGVPVTVGIAVLRYRLYDIDVIINRALVYGSLTAGTVASYAALVVGLGWAARTVAGQEGNEVVVAATTLIVAALFQPARRRIQSLVDRRFYRSRYDAGRTLEAFQARLREELDLGALQRELAGAAQDALHPAFLGLWLRQAGPERRS